MATRLKRYTLQAPINVPEETKTIARQAQVVLKHDDLATKLCLPTESLSVVLERLHIKPFDYNTVAKYKEEKREEANKTGSYKYWQSIPIHAASQVPVFALRKAIQVKLALPDVKILVESLEEHPDPFLVVQMGTERFYIEVWDERNFENKI